MNFLTFKKQWLSVAHDNIILKALVVLMIVSNTILVIYLNSQQAIITLVPPKINSQLVIEQSTASGTFKKSWGMYVASLLGNVKATNVDFIIKTLEPLLTPAVISAMRQSLVEQVNEIKKEKLAISFSPESVSYEKNTKKVYVSGRQIITGRNGDALRNVRTYVIGIDIENYQPRVFYLNAYNKKPKFEKPKVKR